MKQTRIDRTFVEEDGFEIQRGDDVYQVYGTCEGEYIEYKVAGEEPDYELMSFSCWVDRIEEDGFEVDITLTDDEYAQFESYMGDKLDEQI